MVIEEVMLLQLFFSFLGCLIFLSFILQFILFCTVFVLILLHCCIWGLTLSCVSYKKRRQKKTRNRETAGKTWKENNLSEQKVNRGECQNVYQLLEVCSFVMVHVAFCFLQHFSELFCPQNMQHIVAGMHWHTCIIQYNETSCLYGL